LADAQGDIDALLALIREQAASLGIDEHRAAPWVFSGGGPFLSEVLRRPPAYIRSLVAFYSLMDLRSLRAQAPAAVDDEVLERFSPVVALGATSGNLPPIFVGRAGLDMPILNATADQFIEMASKRNLLVSIRNHPEGFHGFDIRNDDAFSRDIIRQAFEFLKAHT
jgi:acetyl esterase/lipase